MMTYGQACFSWAHSSEITHVAFGATVSWADGSRCHVDLHYFGGFGHISALSSSSLNPLLRIRFFGRDRASCFTFGAIFVKILGTPLENSLEVSCEVKHILSV